MAVKIERGETPAKAIEREVLEELAYQLRRPKLWMVNRFAHQRVNFTQYVFVDKYDGSELILGEGQGLGWFLPSEVKELMMVSHARQLIESLGEGDLVDHDDWR